jgi:hypothetical protein
MWFAFSPSGDYAVTDPYFTHALINDPLRALANGEDGPNGMYSYSPTSIFQPIALIQQLLGGCIYKGPVVSPTITYNHRHRRDALTTAISFAVTGSPPIAVAGEHKWNT